MNENLILLYFNAHLDFSGTQEKNEDREIVKDIISQHNTLLLNEDGNCEGNITWSQGDKSNAIDLVMISQNTYRNFSHTHR